MRPAEKQNFHGIKQKSKCRPNVYLGDTLTFQTEARQPSFLKNNAVFSFEILFSQQIARHSGFDILTRFRHSYRIAAQKRVFEEQKHYDFTLRIAISNPILYRLMVQ
jgi:hypothetical protein